MKEQQSKRPGLWKFLKKRRSKVTGGFLTAEVSLRREREPRKASSIGERRRGDPREEKSSALVKRVGEVVQPSWKTI